MSVKYDISKSFYNRYLELNAINRMGGEMLRFMYYKEGKFINPLKKNQIIEQYIQEEIENFKRGEINIPQIEFCLTTKCTLKCADCCALMPGFNRCSHIDMSFDEFKNTLNQLLENVNSIRKLIILGGEPLLHPDLCEMLEYASKFDKVHQISIVSNGTKIPSDKLIETLKNNNKIFFYMSNYSENPKLAPILHYNEIKEKLKENGLKFQMMESWSWFKEHGFSGEKHCEKGAKYHFETCHRTKCLTTLDRKIDICSKAFSGRMQKLIEVKDYIDLDKTKNLKQDLIDFYKKDMIDACEYCIISKDEVRPAIQESELCKI